MAQLGVNFDASRVQPAEAGASVWEGIVPMRIDRSEVAETASKNGSKMLVLHVTAMAGEYQGQSNVIRLNLWNTNPQACEIAQRQLSSICHCTGRMQIQDSDQLNGAMLLGIWAKEDRPVVDQATGVTKTLESCQVKDFRLPDGRTIKEAMGGQPASQPYDPNATRRTAPAPAANAPQAMPAGGAPGFAPGHAPAPQGAPQTQTAGFAPGGGFAPTAPAGGQPAPAAPGMSTVASPYNTPQGGFAPPAGPGGFGQPAAAPPAGPAGGGFVPAGAPGAPQGGFAPQAPSGAAQAGFQPPQEPGGFGQPAAPGGFPGGGQPQPGPWGQG